MKATQNIPKSHATTKLNNQIWQTFKSFSFKTGFNASAESIDSDQPAWTAQADLRQYFFLYVKG